MEREHIHKEQLEALDKLQADGIIFDLDGITDILDSLAENQNNIADIGSSLFFISKTLINHRNSLKTYFKTLGEI